MVSEFASGQLQINAGNDTSVCTYPSMDPLEIGGHPTASGGQEPYTYIWSAHVASGSRHLGASVFLDDTTKANPFLTDPFDKPITFKLVVKDNAGAVKEDSIQVGFSIFYSLCFDFYAYIDQGDTVQLGHDIAMGIPPLRYAWSPNYNISDTSFSSPKVWPDTSTTYTVIVIDSIGCVSWPKDAWVTVKPSGIPQYSNNNSILFPNPVDNSSVIYFEVPTHKNLVIKVMASNGKIILTDEFKSGSYRIGEKIRQSGTYFYDIWDGTKIVAKGQFIKQ